ncbi:glycoside hydrolase family 65 [Halalkalibacter sp. APA_J-10(15)]|uniref:glycoside hydrolase family 65 n=1 Tax=Halalkalibacter sp. APA_J-10(15) TaxID=2933805 RepID=UPI001FF3E127|nr:glycoside hydrolase family 65 [Halalkalibacter sp. APA_J-10(15)]MCK0471068.1 glycoside hydrolase family 65 [Halalkalibacter sp. APA_J-10(15)]
MAIDRKEVVQRHFPKVTEVVPHSPLSVGNGEFAFTADITGLQSFPDAYEVPLSTQSNWGWHSSNGHHVYTIDDVDQQELHTNGRFVKYPLYPGQTLEAYHWLRQNPHRLQLGQLSFQFCKEDGTLAKIEDIKQIEQTLNIWEGCLYSYFTIEGYPVKVKTVCHPSKDELAIKVESPLLKTRRLCVQLTFPNPEVASNEWDQAIDLRWDHPERHRTNVIQQLANELLLRRCMDDDHYDVRLRWNVGEIEQTSVHQFSLRPTTGDQLDLCVAFGLSEVAVSRTVNDAIQASQVYWQKFWLKGGMLDFSKCTDKRAPELERRVILSQFLLAIHSSGSVPPQETGFMYNSWFGKFHLEMHYWHAAHFPLWGRGELLEKSLGWYKRILPKAKELAQSQGYAGARWPKMVGPDGNQSPSPIAVALIWQQPHPITLAELCYRVNKRDDFLKEYKDLVFESAHFMASFAEWDVGRAQYVLGPPLIPAQENHQPEVSINPPYELEYWKYGLDLAIQWAERLNEPVPKKWEEVANHLADSPHKEGVYLAHEQCPSTFTQFQHDHPSMVASLGVLPGERINHPRMRQTLKKVKDEWDWDSAWGWDFPMCAMTAARLGETEWAVDFLLMDGMKNTYLQNGHNYQRIGLTSYLPGNGALLLAVAMMAAGYDGHEETLLGFPKNGEWKVEMEGIHPIL